MARLRGVLIHHYMGVDIDAVWELTQRQLPELKYQFEAILANTDE